MSAQSYTPAQYLEAARRAESEGKRDYALQVYRYLAEQFPGSNEGLAARDGLYRMGEMTRPSQRAEASAGLGRNGAASPAAARAATQQHPAHHGGFGLGYGPPAHAERTQPAAREQPQHEHAQVHELDDLPEPADAYRVSRLLARLAGIVGWVLFVVGLLLLFAMAAGALFNLKLPLFALPGFGFMAAGLVVTGAILGLLAQIARASFDSANAVRHLAAIERAKAGG